MNNICAFAGHGNMSYDDETRKTIYEKCEELITLHDVNEFWVGNYGNFDKTSAGVVRELKKKYAFVKLTLVIPYVTAEINRYRDMYYGEYDSIIIADIPCNTPKRFGIIKCNQFMIDRANYLIAYVVNSFGGAAKTLEYAKRKGNMVIYNVY